MNRYSNIIKAVQKAVGDKQGELTMFVYEGSDSHSCFCHPKAKVKEKIAVECVTIDEFLKGWPVNVIKMDIEGNEPYALEGMKQTISKSDNLILFAEFAPELLRIAGVNPEDYLTQLKSLGFDIQVINEQQRSLKPVTKDLLTKRAPFWHTNLYCVKRN